MLLPGLRKKVMLVAFLVILSNLVAAEQIFDGWIYSGDSIEHVNYTFTLTLSSSEDRLYISSDVESVIINLHDCEANVAFRYCFEKVEFNLSEGIGKMDYEKDIEIPELYLTIDELLPALTVEHTILNSTPVLNQLVRIDVTVTNGGDNAAENIEYRASLPDFAEVEDSPLISYANNEIIWTGSLSTGEEESFYYKIKLLKLNTSQYSAAISYTYDDNKAKFNTSIVEIIPTNPLIITFDASENNKVNAEIPISFSLTNADSFVDIPIDRFTITLPYLLPITSGTESIYPAPDRNTYYWNISNIEAGETMNLTLKVRSKVTINFTVAYDLLFDYQGFGFSSGENKTIKVNFDELVPTIEFTPTKSSYESNEEISYRYIVENTDTSIFFSNVTFHTESDVVAASDGMQEQLLTSEQVIVHSGTFVTPWVEENRQMCFNLSGSYSTMFGEKKSYKAGECKTLIPKDFNSSISINRTGPGNLTHGALREFTVIATNTGSNTLTSLVFQEVIDSGMYVDGNLNKMLTGLHPGENVTLYTYKVEPGIVNTSGTAFKTRSKYIIKNKEYVEFSSNIVPVFGTVQESVEFTPITEPIATEIVNVTETIQDNITTEEQNAPETIIPSENSSRSAIFFWIFIGLLVFAFVFLNLKYNKKS